MAKRDKPERVADEQEDATDQEVVCFFSGRRVPRDKAVQVRLGPGRKVWMHPAFCRDG